MYIPQGFCDLKGLIPDAVIDVWYATSHNLTGKPLSGYHANGALCTLQMGAALKNVANEAAQMGYQLHIYDAYRPQKAVDDFIAWAAMPEDNKTKADFYPNIDKCSLFKEGYIASRSGHSRGSVVDLTLVKGQACLDMGTHFDFMDVTSHHGALGLTDSQTENRLLLRQLMERHGFAAYEREWWHYRLDIEPFPDTYYDFDISPWYLE